MYGIEGLQGGSAHSVIAVAAGAAGGSDGGVPGALAGAVLPIVRVGMRAGRVARRANEAQRATVARLGAFGAVGMELPEVPAAASAHHKVVARASVAAARARRAASATVRAASVLGVPIRTDQHRAVVPCAARSVCDVECGMGASAARIVRGRIDPRIRITNGAICRRSAARSRASQQRDTKRQHAQDSNQQGSSFHIHTS